MNHLPVASVRLDTRACILHANAMAEDLLATSARRMRGAAITRFLPDGAKLLEQTKEQMGGQMGTVSARKATLINAQGGKISVSVHAAWGREDEWEGRQEGWTLVLIPIVLKDMTARANALKHQAGTISTMNAMLAHEIKNPLAGITGAAQLLSMNLSAEDLELTDLIVSESRRIVSLLEQVEQFGNVTAPQMQAINIHDVLDRARRSAIVGFAADMTVIETYDPSLPFAMGDPDQLLQVILNLIKNASEAAGKDGGTIELKTYYEQSLRVRNGNGSGNKTLPLQIEIIDDGPGLPPEIAADVFEPFVSGRENGTGLGLALAAKIISDHHGWLSVSSAPGRTVFRISLALAPKDMTPKEEER